MVSKKMFLSLSAIVAAASASATSERMHYRLDYGWRFALDGAAGGGFGPECKPGAFPMDYTDKQVSGLEQVGGVKDVDDCERACCNDPTCAIYQFCNTSDCMPSMQIACWIGKLGSTHDGKGWKSGARKVTPPPPSPPNHGGCTDRRCQPGFDDSSWRKIQIPHDFVVEGNFSEGGDKSHGYLPFNKGWYRKNITIPATQDQTVWLTFDGTQANTQVWLNGMYIGGHASGYTPYSLVLNSSVAKFGGENSLVVFVDATHPDGWWYDGGGIYRHVWLTVTNAVHICEYGVYSPAVIAGNSTISGTAEAGFTADATVSPQIEMQNDGTTAATVDIQVEVMAPDGSMIGKSSTSASVAAGENTTISLTNIQIPSASLWHVGPSEQPLYTLVTTVMQGTTVIDTESTTFGVRKVHFDAAMGFMLNDQRIKIKGNANHQDFAGVGVAVPDIIQAHRIGKLQDMNANGWRTAHNVPTPALLDAADKTGFLVWDENHRNGQDSECEILVRRDRNHPCVVIWSLCNEVLCNTNNITKDALRLKALIKKLDPLGQRPVSANNNGINGPDTPLDLQGFDYNTKSYDAWHARAPNIPSISSETSSAVSDRGELLSNAAAGHVDQYDNTAPGWGQTAEGAWGGIGQKDGQGILTRDFMSGGFTWTGWDYKGEPTPDAWPDINSHFGIIDEAGFPKDRYYWYQAWFGQPSPPVLHVFPSWTQAEGTVMDMWAFSNADEVELIVNGKSLGKSRSGNFSHASWSKVQYVAGEVVANAYTNGKMVATTSMKTAGAPAALVASVKDGVGTKLYAGCDDVLLVQVAVVDAQGLTDSTAMNNVTFTVTGNANFIGSGNGDPACHVPDKSPVRNAYHGLVLGVFQETGSTGSVTVTVSSPGLKSSTLTVDVVAMPASMQAGNEWWCHSEPKL